jgi:superfamily I DNA/RNA helicase
VEINNIDKLIFELANNPLYKIFNSKVGYFTVDQEKEIWSQSIEKFPSQFDVDFFFSEYNDVILAQNINSLESYTTASRIGRNCRIGRKDKVEIWNIVEEFKKQKEGNYSKPELCNLISVYFRNQKVKPYSFLICDEVQDFSNPELTLLRSLVDEKENDLFLVGDPFQNIYKRSLNFAKSGISVKGRRSRKLKINYRTTEEIKHLAMKIVSNLAVDDFDGNQENLKGYLSLLHGNPPSYEVFITPEEEDKDLIEKLKSIIVGGLIQPNEICLCTRTNGNLDNLKKLLNSEGVKYLDLSSLKQNISAVNVSTFHNIKGHEFKVVIAKGMSESTVPYRYTNYTSLTDRERESYHQQERSLYYVVFSRAIQTVIITGVGEKSKWLEK